MSSETLFFTGKCTLAQRHAATLFHKRRRPGEALLSALICASALTSALLLLGIAGYVFYKGFGVLHKSFFTTVTSDLKGTVGIAGNIVNTLYILVTTLLIVTPVGVGAAVYLNEYAKPGPLVELIEFATETLSGLPSVVFGLFGYVFFGRVLGFRYSLLNGALTLSLMTLPLMVRNTQEALRTVPERYRSASLGLGAAKWYMIRTVLLPCAWPGILTGMILAMGRILGESAALMFTAGSARALPRLGESFSENGERLFSKLFQSGGTLTVEMYLQMQDGKYGIAFGIACVLILTVFFINVLLKAKCEKIF